MATILLIDDDEQLVETLTLFLESAGHTVIAAENGAIGLEQFHEHPIDLVITDLVMPEQEGIETIVALRDLTHDMPIIAMSGRTTLGDNRAVYLNVAASLGAQHTLTKPFSGQEMLRAVEKLLASS